MKDYKEWLQQLKQSYRSEAIANIINKGQCETTKQVLDRAFKWSETIQGGQYWGDIYNNIEEYLLPVEESKERTGEEFAQDFIPEIRDKLIHYLTRSKRLNMEFESHKHVIYGGFNWSETGEGYDFWSNIRSNVEKYLVVDQPKEEAVVSSEVQKMIDMVEQVREILGIKENDTESMLTITSGVVKAFLEKKIVEQEC